MGKGRVSMNDLVLAATIHRVKLCEDKIKDFEQMVSTLPRWHKIERNWPLKGFQA